MENRIFFLFWFLASHNDTKEFLRLEFVEEIAAVGSRTFLKFEAVKLKSRRILEGLISS